MARRLLIFTDLDGTLLDVKTYSFAEAVPALRRVEAKGVPLVACTSKTRIEIEWYRRKLSNHDPFIAENGGAIFIPVSYFSLPYPFDREDEDYRVIELGTPYTELVRVLRSVRDRQHMQIRGFADMTVEEIARVAGLPVEQARLAKNREYDEPFVVDAAEEAVERMRSDIVAHGLNHTRGGRFYHILGDNDKGKAVRVLVDLFRTVDGGVETMALGDSENDVSMLQAVDYPVWVGQGGKYEEARKAIPALQRAPASGPAGWNAAVNRMLSGF